MIHDKKLVRAKVAGTFIYFHPDAKICTAQMTKRHEMIEDRKFSQLLSREVGLLRK
jgi:hypothetical protein